MATILLVDDDVAIRLLNGDYVLKPMGYNVLVAADGIEGLELVKEHGPSIDLVIVDKDMPRMDGIEMIRQIRRDPATYPLKGKICLASSHTLDSLGDAVAGLNIDTDLPKPYRPENLKAKVAELIGPPPPALEPHVDEGRT